MEGEAGGAGYSSYFNPSSFLSSAHTPELLAGAFTLSIIEITGDSNADMPCFPVINPSGDLLWARLPSFLVLHTPCPVPSAPPHPLRPDLILLGLLRDLTLHSHSPSLVFSKAPALFTPFYHLSHLNKFPHLKNKNWKIKTKAPPATQPPPAPMSGSSPSQLGSCVHRTPRSLAVPGLGRGALQRPFLILDNLPLHFSEITSP